MLPPQLARPGSGHGFRTALFVPSETEVVAVFNTSDDTVDLLRNVLQTAGFVVVTAFTTELRDGRVDLDAFMRLHQPKVIVYDIAVPYEENWRLFQHVKSRPACRDARFVLTTTNAAHVQKLAGPQQLLHEIVGKPYDLNEIAVAVKQAARQRPTS